MPINREVFRSPAIKGDISGIAIATTTALDAIVDALQKISGGNVADLDDELVAIRKSSAELVSIFDQLTGWEADA